MASSSALSQHLSQLLQQQDTHQTGSVALSQAMQTLHVCCLKPCVPVQDELLLNSNLASSTALSQHLSQLLQQKDTKHTGSVTLSQAVHTLLTLSHESLGLSNTYLACVLGHTAPSVNGGSAGGFTGGSISYDKWANEAAAMMYSCLDPKASDARSTAVQEFRDRGAAQKKRSANAEAVKVGRWAGI